MRSQAPPTQSGPPGASSDFTRGIIWLIALPLEVLCHTQFGVRYLSHLSIFTVLFVMIVAKALMGLIMAILAIFTGVSVLPFLKVPLSGGHTFDLYLFDLFTWVVFIAGTCHQVSIRRRIQRDEMGFTYDSGRPFMFVWGLVSRDEWLVKRYWEPGAWCFLSYLLRGVDSILSWYLFLSAFALLCKANLIYYHMRAMRWDLHDQAMLGEYLARSVTEGRDQGAARPPATPVQVSSPDASHATRLCPRTGDVLRALGLSTPAEPEAPPASAPHAGPILVRCPGCGKRIKAAARMAGRRAACPHCGAEIAIPMPRGDGSLRPGGSSSAGRAESHASPA
jgi:hypothetical protein